MLFGIALTGPTASGKTKISIELAKRLGCEIISLDSMQIYKGMDIGTAKATEEEMENIPHHMLGIAEPSQDYSTELYREAALDIARDISARGKTPLFAGGTGLYLDTLLRAPQSDVPKSDENMRNAEYSEEDKHSLWLKLFGIDPESAEKIHENNVRRVLRAIEIYESTGITKTEHDRLSRISPSDIKILHFTLDFHDRDLLYRRIDSRVDVMIGDGLAEEVRALYESGRLKEGTTASQAIGYKEIIEYLNGRVTLSSAIEQIKLSSRRYAKRQLTWFRRGEASRIYVDTDDGRIRDASEIVEEILSRIQNGGFNEEKNCG